MCHTVSVVGGLFRSVVQIQNRNTRAIPTTNHRCDNGGTDQPMRQGGFGTGSALVSAATTTGSGAKSHAADITVSSDIEPSFFLASHVCRVIYLPCVSIRRGSPSGIPQTRVQSALHVVHPGWCTRIAPGWADPAAFVV